MDRMIPEESTDADTAAFFKLCLQAEGIEVKQKTQWERMTDAEDCLRRHHDPRVERANSNLSGFGNFE